jgi:hypothetical protein
LGFLKWRVEGMREREKPQPLRLYQKRTYVAMTVMTIYVKGKSKAAINRRLEAGEVVVGTEYRLSKETTWPLGEAIPDGTVVKVFSVLDAFGTPYAKSYGRWNAKRGRIQ